MKYIIFIALVLMGTLCKAQTADSTRVLFIGNSLTYFNDMPQMFRNVALNKGKKVSVTFYAPGGTGFVNHVNDPAVYSLFRTGHWDIVVLQPGTGESGGASASVDLTITRGRQLMDSILHYNNCARIYLYEISNGVSSATTYNAYFSSQQRIRDSVTKMADGLRIPMVPAGECMRAYYTLHQNLLLHGGYGDVHPNANGSLLIAAAFYSALFQDTLTPCTYYAGINADTARKFFSIADTVVLRHLADWRINTYNLHAGFSYVRTNNTVNFTSLASNATQVSWDFGDNSAAVTSPNPVHNYAVAGTYTVTLRVSNSEGCTDSMRQQITIDGATSIDRQLSAADLVSVYPNPFRTSFSIQQPQLIYGRYEIYSISGRLLTSGNTGDNETVINLSGQPDGLYLLKLSDKKGNTVYSRVLKSDRP
ncbi:PKD domain-containing protein [Taibaiella sp. KBW10]|uniref:PKD domain-containing protein n=1 Tax=Taibaiella sp. KBW10 TaxID=2153357 RepID=UPI000F5AF96A|nr:PKD domain-containing protein [Taibaiella sp. KBW10]